MIKTKLETKRELTGVDDVRRVRDAIARQHHGDLAEHIKESNRIAAVVIRKYKLRKVRRAR